MSDADAVVAWPVEVLIARLRRRVRAMRSAALLVSTDPRRGRLRLLLLLDHLLADLEMLVEASACNHTNGGMKDV